MSHEPIFCMGLGAKSAVHFESKMKARGNMYGANHPHVSPCSPAVAAGIFFQNENRETKKNNTHRQPGFHVQMFLLAGFQDHILRLGAGGCLRGEAWCFGQFWGGFEGKPKGSQKETSTANSERISSVGNSETPQKVVGGPFRPRLVQMSTRFPRNRSSCWTFSPPNSDVHHFPSKCSLPPCVFGLAGLKTTCGSGARRCCGVTWRTCGASASPGPTTRCWGSW